MICRCGHRYITHRYLMSAGANVGECLAPQCWCEHVEEAEAS